MNYARVCVCVCFLVYANCIAVSQDILSPKSAAVTDRNINPHDDDDGDGDGDASRSREWY